MKKIDESVATSLKMTLHSGRKIDVFNPQEEDIDIGDIAHALSNLCRYGGHCPGFYSVAQHSVLCSYEPGSPEEQFEFLMHDASEAYMADLPRPIKRRMPMYEEIEDRVLTLVFMKYNINPIFEFKMSERAKEVDDIVLTMEYENFFVKDENEIELWSPEKAKSEFLKRYQELSNQIKNG
jgi:5'-deoxynucleotidase YfbR-like HD superfamily hydrolase